MSTTAVAGAAATDPLAVGHGWKAQGHPVASAVVVATRRSAPRPVGTRMVVRADDAVAGSVSGGCVEADVCRVAQEVLLAGTPRLVTYGIADDEAFEIGLPCGGEIDIFVEAL
ncbi:XdhC family protein [Patulibacter minatonensis]|uniref:XdhC family protein n=1 Tax=Patulibacter minatonensis TaxID=298163 RepID=UPI00047DB18F|nr:XdhC family protein [Patulibacter minatonensis]